MPPRILINVPGYGTSHQAGVMRVCFNLLQALVARGGYDYSLRTTYARADLPPYLQAAPIEVITVPPLRHKFLSVFPQTLSVPALARRIGAAAVLGMDYVGPLFGGPPRAMIVHDVFPRTIPDQYSLGLRWRFDIVHGILTRTSDAIVAVSETTAQDLARFYPAARHKTVVIRLDTTLRDDADAQGPPPDVEPPYILTVGNGTPNKNLAAIGRALQLLDERGVSVQLVHVGNDPADTIRSAILRPLRSARILRVTGVDDAGLIRLYRGAACYVNASFYEGFCLPIIEAQKLGCPVICSDRSATAEVAGQGAVLCDPHDPSALAAHIERLLRDEMFRQALRAAGTRNAVRFSWAKSAEAYEALFDRLIARARLGV
jgi:glycosyltransferase involved in cell wall biosynthesis